MRRPWVNVVALAAPVGTFLPVGTVQMTAFSSIPGAIDLRSSSLRVQALLKENAIEKVTSPRIFLSKAPAP